MSKASNKPRLWSALSRVLLSVVVVLAVVPATIAGIRTSVTYSNFLNPEATAVAAVFARGGIYAIAGGVVLQGQAKFYLETDGRQQNIPANAVTPTINSAGKVFLTYRGASYQMEIHDGLACPLGKFVARNGQIAFTIPSRDDEAARARMNRAGLVDNEIAKEFADTRFAPLVEKADFARTTELPKDIKDRIMSSINNKVGPGRALDNDGDDSYVNTDQQVTYQVYLVAGTRSVDISGVPMRYYWDAATDGSAIVSNVQAFSQDWPQGQTLADLSNPFVDIGQYDLVSLYQSAGLFRELSKADSAAFRKFVDKACEIRK